jgi:hypothetical protein
MFNSIHTYIIYNYHTNNQCLPVYNVHVHFTMHAYIYVAPNSKSE